MFGFWGWLNQNAGALQGLLAIVAAVLTTASIGVLYITLRAVLRQAAAAEAQADAARKQTEVAQAQTDVTIQQLAFARKQVELLERQMEQNLAPLLVSEPDDRQGMRNYKVVNRGPGVAFQVHYWEGGFEMRSVSPKQVYPVQPSTLGTGNGVYLPVPPAWQAFTVCYKGADRLARWTIVYQDARKPQEHIVTRGSQQVYLS